MCDPVTATAATLAIGGELYRHSAEASAARRTRSNILQSADLQSKDISARAAEQEVAAAREILGTQRDATEVEGILLAAAGEAGVSGQSLRLLRGDARAEAGRATQAIKDNLNASRRASQRERSALRLNTAQQLHAARGPSKAATVLRIGAHGVNTATTIKSRKPTPGE